MSNLRADTSLTKEKKPAGGKPSRAGRGGDQISQIKNLLISYKGQMKEKKAAGAPEPVPAPGPKPGTQQRLSNLSASSSVSKMNVSAEQGRSSQRSQEPKARLLKSIDKKEPAKAKAEPQPVQPPKPAQPAKAP